jgi:transposase-like protein
VGVWIQIGLTPANLNRRSVMEDVFVDAENKIIADCPECGSQTAIYLLSSSRLNDGFHGIECDSCEKTYLVNLKIELKCWSTTYKCKEMPAYKDVDLKESPDEQT